ncbi:MAG: RnfABCDGE type electron transport complex subunit B [Candidatus Berkiella sp.]
MTAPYHVAVIEESACIGCTKCLDVCPVDAIVGTSGHMHTVISAQCIGCDLCLPPCPVQCISLVASGISKEERSQLATIAKAKHQARKARLDSLAAQKELADKKAMQNADDILASALLRAKRNKTEFVPHE